MIGAQEGTTSPAWARALQLRQATIAWLPLAKVELERDPSANIGGLHQKAADVRAHANRVRDVVFEVMAIKMELHREACATALAYEGAMAQATIARSDEEAVKRFKTKEEREMVLRQGILPVYQAMVDAENRMEAWELYLKMVNLVYYSLSNTRDDLSTQVAIIKQQMFNGEVKPNGELSKLSSLSELLGAEARQLFENVSSEPESVGVGGEVDWAG
jgi:hypothetical protein